MLPNAGSAGLRLPSAILALREIQFFLGLLSFALCRRSFGESALKLESADVGEAHIDHRARGNIGALGAEKLAGRSESLDAQSGRRDKFAYGIANRKVVIEHKDNRLDSVGLAYAE